MKKAYNSSDEFLQEQQEDYLSLLQNDERKVRNIGKTILKTSLEYAKKTIQNAKYDENNIKNY